MAVFYIFVPGSKTSKAGLDSIIQGVLASLKPIQFPYKEYFIWHRGRSLTIITYPGKFRSKPLSDLWNCGLAFLTLITTTVFCSVHVFQTPQPEMSFYRKHKPALVRRREFLSARRQIDRKWRWASLSTRARVSDRPTVPRVNSLAVPCPALTLCLGRKTFLIMTP